MSLLKAKFFHFLMTLRFVSVFSRRPSKKSLPVLYKASRLFVLTNASLGQFAFLCITNLAKSERIHRAGSRAATGCLSFSTFSIQ